MKYEWQPRWVDLKRGAIHLRAVMKIMVIPSHFARSHHLKRTWMTWYSSSIIVFPVVSNNGQQVICFASDSQAFVCAISIFGLEITLQNLRKWIDVSLRSIRLSIVIQFEETSNVCVKGVQRYPICLIMRNVNSRKWQLTSPQIVESSQTQVSTALKGLVFASARLPATDFGRKTPVWCLTTFYCYYHANWQIVNTGARAITTESYFWRCGTVIEHTNLEFVHLQST